MIIGHEIFSEHFTGMCWRDFTFVDIGDGHNFNVMCHMTVVKPKKKILRSFQLTSHGFTRFFNTEK